MKRPAMIDARLLERIREALREHRPCREVLRNYRKDGTLFYNELSITPLFDEQDQLTYFIGVQKDVTQLAEALQELEALKAKHGHE